MVLRLFIQYLSRWRAIGMPSARTVAECSRGSQVAPQHRLAVRAGPEDGAGHRRVEARDDVVAARITDRHQPGTGALQVRPGRVGAPPLWKRGERPLVVRGRFPQDLGVDLVLRHRQDFVLAVGIVENNVDSPFY